MSREPSAMSRQVASVWERLFVWTGGALFVVSLGAGAYAYLILWAVPAPGGGTVAVAADAGLFTLFALHHSLFARASIKALMARALPERLLRSVYVWTASLLLLIVLALWQPIGGELYRVSGWRAALTAAIQLGGLWLVVRSVARIDALELAGIHQPGALEQLQVDGPYRWVRHPVYLGWFLAVLGTAHMTGDRLLFAVVSSLYVLVAVPLEERSLRRTYGDDYAAYVDRVPWRLVPYVY
jgi:protein-S-isoprenylcysteine O-methyltransferase Ste14